MMTNTYLDEMVSNPLSFLRRTELFILPNGKLTEPEDSVVERFDGRDLCRAYPEDSAFINKIVITGKDKIKIMFMTATGAIDPFLFTKALETIESENIQLGPQRHLKGEFAAPAKPKFAYLFTSVKNGDNTVKPLPPLELVNTNGDMIVRAHEGTEPDWVLNWSYLYVNGAHHVVGLTVNGRLLRLQAEGMRYKDITPRGVRVNDVVTMMKTGQEPQYIIATSSGILLDNEFINGTSRLDIKNLCFDAQSQQLWFRTKVGNTYRMWFEGGRFHEPELWSETPTNFMDEDTVSEKMLAGPVVKNPVLTGWSRPKEIVRDAKGTGKFTVTYHRREIIREQQRSSVRPPPC